LAYILLGILALSPPISRSHDLGLTDIAFMVTSAVSTTGLTTVSTGDSFTFFGEFVLLLLFQVGGLGFMTLRSFIAFSTGHRLAPDQAKTWSVGFSLPSGVDMRGFIRHIVAFSLILETLGAIVLYFEFAAAGVENAAWSAVFHSVSAFATAGFSLWNSGLEGFRGSVWVNLTVGALCYFGSIGFIVLQDFYMAVRNRSHRISFTSKIILVMTAAIFMVDFPLVFFLEPALHGLPFGERILVTGFQIMAASSTSGFNTVPIVSLSSPTLSLIIIAMVVGASPSGTGGGIRTTTVSSLFAVLFSVLRGHREIGLFGHQIPMNRVISAVGTVTLYLGVMACGVFLLSVFERQDFLKIVFEAASALGTVGLSMGITGDLSTAGKWVVILLMYLGLIGPITLGLALLHSGRNPAFRDEADLAT
jgi:trk system potassium uptake protein TrkH